MSEQEIKCEQDGFLCLHHAAGGTPDSMCAGCDGFDGWTDGREPGDHEQEQGHTPGPWFIWKERAGYDAEDLLDDAEHDIYAGEPTECTPGHMSGPVFGICHISDMDEANECDETRLANAKLIAAAPDLVAALKRCINHLICDGVPCNDTPEAIEQARAALAKATE